MQHDLLIPKPADFSFTECLWFLDRGYDDCLHRVHGPAVIKLLPAECGPFLMRLSDAGPHLRIEVLGGSTASANPEGLRAYVTEWLDLNRDIGPLRTLAAADPVFSRLVAAYWGLRLISIPDLFEALCWSIIGQQINLSFAYRLKRRLVEEAGFGIEHDGHTYHHFPKPEQVLGIPLERMKELQFSTQKARYLHAVAAAFLEGKLSRDMLLQKQDTAEVIDALTQLNGIGEWTANYVAMKCLRRMDAVTYTDAGLLNGYRKLKGLDAKPPRRELENFFSKFAGWEAYVVFYIWRSLS